MVDWTHLSLTADARKTLESELAASQGDYRKTMQAIDDYVDDLVSDLFDPDDPEHSLAYTDPDAIADAARDIVSLAQEAADSRYMVQRAAWQEAADADFPAFAGADREDWTRVMWDVQKGFSNTDYNGLTYGQVMDGRARSGVTIMDLLPKAVSSNPDDLQQAYADFFRSLAAHAGQRRQMANIAGDPTRPRWARVPRGRVTCAFCTMLAGRGFVYTSEEAAGGGLGSKYHNHCDCEPVPSWGEAKLAGYDPRRLDALYRRAKAGLPDGASYRDVLSRMRAQGGVTDSPAAQAGSGGGGKPPKPPKATAAAPQPDEPGKGRKDRTVNGMSIRKWNEYRDVIRERYEEIKAADTNAKMPPDNPAKPPELAGYDGKQLEVKYQDGTVRSVYMTGKSWNHTLYGSINGGRGERITGGHLYGYGWVGKSDTNPEGSTEFPEWAGPDDIADAIVQILSNGSNRKSDNGWEGDATMSHGEFVEVVKVHVHVSSRGIISSAYPIRDGGLNG